MQRRVLLTGEVNEAMFTHLVNELSRLSNAGPEPIQIDLYSDGGFASAGLAIYGAIRACPCLIYTTAYGACQSAATVILAGSDWRSMALDCWFMVHDSPGKPKKKREKIQREREEVQWAQILELHSQLPADEWRALSKKETYLNPAECLQYGVVDQILKGSKDAQTDSGDVSRRKRS